MKKVALVTGGARGIGWGIARCLAADGCDIAVCGTRDEDAVQEALADLRRPGTDVLYCQADVSDGAARARLLSAVRERFGRLNVLVNNAGVAPKVRADILEATEESFEWVMKVNLQGPYFLTQAAARWMIEQREHDAGLPGMHHQRFVRLGYGGVDQPRRVLHLQGRDRHGHATVGGAAGRIRHPGVRDPPGGDRDRHDPSGAGPV